MTRQSYSQRAAAANLAASISRAGRIFLVGQDLKAGQIGGEIGVDASQQMAQK